MHPERLEALQADLQAAIAQLIDSSSEISRLAGILDRADHPRADRLNRLANLACRLAEYAESKKFSRLC